MRRKRSAATAFKRIAAVLMSLMLCFSAFPVFAFAQSGLISQAPAESSLAADKDAKASSTYPYKDGYAQIDGIYAFDAETYPYGSPVTCGGYDYDSGAWTRDTPTITEKGTQLQFEARGTFVSGNMDDPSVNPVIDDGITMDGSAISWSVDNTSLATIDFQSGLFTPLSNGTVTVTATLNSAKSYSGQALKVAFDVVIDISQTAYITGLQILAPDGITPISESETSYFDLYQYLVDSTGVDDFNTLATTTAPQFYAKVDVVDPTTGAESSYVVRTGSELAAACGISDLTWGQVKDSTNYSIDPTLGMVRMLYPTTTTNETIRVYTRSTKGGSLLDDRASLRFAVPGSDSEEEEEGYIPAETLTVMAYYEQYPADVNNTEDEYWLRLNEHEGATSVTYSLSELQSISSRDEAFTMIGTDRSCQAIATGVNLMLLLQDALGPNVTINDIEGFYFKTFDEGYMPGQYFVSASALFSDRYFYPYYFQGGDLTGATQVYPILAWSSKLYWSDKYPDINVENPANWDRDAMSGASRFRLIFGAQPGSGFSTRNSVYCIETMYVVLKGGPDISGGDGDDDDPANPDNPGDGGGEDSKGDKDGDPSGDSKQDSQGEPNQAGDQPKDATSDDSRTTSAAQAQSSSDAQDASESTRRQTIYQMINNNELDVTLKVENTLGWLLIPLASIAFAAGVAYALLWYRRQIAPVPSAPVRETSQKE